MQLQLKRTVQRNPKNREGLVPYVMLDISRLKRLCHWHSIQQNNDFSKHVLKHHVYHHHHQSLNCEGRWGATDDFTIFERKNQLQLEVMKGTFDFVDFFCCCKLEVGFG